MKKIFILLAVVAFCGCNRFQWTHDSTDYSIEKEIEETRKKAEANLPGENLLIQIDFYEIEKSNFNLYQTAWEYADKNVIIFGGDVLSANGLRVAVTKDDFRSVWIQKFNSLRNVRKSSQQLAVLSGYSGSFFVGEVIPVQTVFIWQYPGFLIRSFELRNVGFSIEVSPRIIWGNTVELTITPVISHLVDKITQTIKVTELRTTLTVERGRQVIIGSNNERGETLGQTFFSKISGTVEKKQLVVLTVL